LQLLREELRERERREWKRQVSEDWVCELGAFFLVEACLYNEG